jgi:hypothetical protein
LSWDPFESKWNESRTPLAQKSYHFFEDAEYHGDRFAMLQPPDSKHNTVPRQLIVAARGYVRSARGYASNDHHVCIILGGGTLSVVPRSEELSEYAFIGECYIQGLFRVKLSMRYVL